MTQFHGKPDKSKLLVKVPKYVQHETNLAFKLYELGFKGGLETGWNRAKQLTGRKYSILKNNQLFIPIEDLKYMRNWYARHYYTSKPTFDLWKEQGKPLSTVWHNKRGIISWLIWGGDSGLKWVNKMTPILNKHFNTNYKYL